MKLNNVLFAGSLVLLLMGVFPSISYSQNQLNIVQIDTIVLRKGVAINSNMELIRDHCFDRTFARIDSLSMPYVKANIKLFNQELKTDVFSTVYAILGFAVQTTIPGYVMVITEWHFKDEENTQKVVSKLNRLEKGIIRYPIVPTACFWHHSGSKIYILKYNPGNRDYPNKEPELFFLCLKSLMEEK